MSNLPLHFTEWSSSYTPADPVHDSYISTPYILEKLKTATEYADSMSYWTFTDIFEETGPRATPFHGGFGLINYQDIKKPAFRAYEFLNRLGPSKLRCEDPRALITKSPDGGVQALFWDYTNPLPDKVNNQQFFITDVKPNPKGEVYLRLTGLKPGSYRVSVYRVGYRINDPYADYLDLGRPNQLTRAQATEIRNRNNGKPVHVETIRISSGGTFQKTFPIRENDVYQVTILPRGSTAN